MDSSAQQCKNIRGVSARQLVRRQVSISDVSTTGFVVCGRKSSRKTHPKVTVKYSAARLHEKGVVLEIDGLPHSQYVAAASCHFSSAR